ncbi:MAG: YggS family pyridoxal phosphate-dependent enzyme [Candidatus Saganbacteria bacterium]|nr:YggS family pyridoxal phosphate-dependent enzyme [Candidatus Saganbacteria bacterium]
MSIKQNLNEIKRRVAEAAQAAGRDPAGIKIIAAVKTRSIEEVLEILEAGLRDIGDNRVQEAAARQSAIRQKFPDVAWHMIGHLQRNKVRQALDIFDIIQSVDSERLAKELDRRAKEKGIRVPILIEVNTSGEETKYGIPVDSAIDLVKKIANLQNLLVRGLMTLGPLSPEAGRSRAAFAGLRRLSESLKALNLPNVEMAHLSMGMTDDLEAAIAEGANMVRIGRALFGQRSG